MKEEIREQAKKEVAEEARRIAIDNEKKWIQRPLLLRLFPYKLTIKIQRRK